MSIQPKFTELHKNPFDRINSGISSPTKVAVGIASIGIFTSQTVDRLANIQRLYPIPFPKIDSFKTSICSFGGAVALVCAASTAQLASKKWNGSFNESSLKDAAEKTRYELGLISGVSSVALGIPNLCRNRMVCPIGSTAFMVGMTFSLGTYKALLRRQETYLTPTIEPYRNPPKTDCQTVDNEE